MSVRKRTWTTRKGELKEACIVDYTDQDGDRHIETFKLKKDANARAAKVNVRRGARDPHRAEQKHKGHHRYYDETAVIDALVLSELAEWGIPAVVAAHLRAVQPDGTVAPLPRLVRLAYDQFDERERADERLWLSVSRPNRNAPPHGGSRRIDAHTTRASAPRPPKLGQAEGATAASAMLGARLHVTGKTAARSHEAIDVPAWSSSSIVLNLTDLFRHLRNKGGQ